MVAKDILDQSFNKVLLDRSAPLAAIWTETPKAQGDQNSVHMHVDMVKPRRQHDGNMVLSSAAQGQI